MIMLKRKFNNLSNCFKKSFSTTNQHSYSFATINNSESGSSTPKFNLNLKGIGNKIAKPFIDPSINGNHYDVAIIGGGSAGLAFSFVIFLLS